jgi:hypothetical protein
MRRVARRRFRFQKRVFEYWGLQGHYLLRQSLLQRKEWYSRWKALARLSPATADGIRGHRCGCLHEISIGKTLLALHRATCVVYRLFWNIWRLETVRYVGFSQATTLILGVADVTRPFSPFSDSHNKYSAFRLTVELYPSLVFTFLHHRRFPPRILSDETGLVAAPL